MAQIAAARARIAGLSMITPLVGCDIAPPGKTIRLKLENLQPIGSFKVRPIANAVLSKNRARIERRHLHHQLGQQRARRGVDGAPLRDQRHRRRTRQCAGGEAGKTAAFGRANRGSRQRCLVACNRSRHARRSRRRLHRRGARPGFAGRRCNDRRRNSRTVARCRGDPDPLWRRRPGMRHCVRGARAAA